MSDCKSKADLSRLLLEAVDTGAVTSVSDVLDQGADVNCRDDEEYFVCVVD